MSRVLVVWCPDWPVVAATEEAGVPGRAPAAVAARNIVLACNGPARAEGVRRGMRRRDAQSRCPELALLPASPDRDARAFEPVLAAVEELRPGVAPLRPGLLAVRAPGRYYGGETAAAAVIAERLVGLGVWDCRVGVADDLFTAEQAARRAEPQDSVVIPAGGSPAFLCGLPVEVLDDADLVGTLRRLGLVTLGDFAGLPARDVGARFGAFGAKVHRLARGQDPSLLPARTPPPDLVRHVEFEPPLEDAEAVCFSVRQTAERFVTELAARGLVCTEVRIEVVDDRGNVSGRAAGRSWAHTRWFGAADLVDRLRWQLASPLEGRPGSRNGGRLPGRPGVPGVTAPVARVSFVPETVELVGTRAETLWGGGSDDRVDRAVARVQSMLGYEAVTVPVLQGGRGPADRQALVTWGERPGELRSPELPWPGSIPPPAPSRVFSEAWPVVVADTDGRVVRVSERGALSGEPARFRSLPDAGGWRPISAWAGPWPVDEQWWNEPARRIARFQIVGADGRAWLMRCEGQDWWAEASYD